MPRTITHPVKKTLAKPEQAHYEALSIAKYLFSLDPQRDYFNDRKKISTGAGFSTVLLGNWRLNQMLYLCQIFHYVKYGKFLFFKDDLYAFDNGFIVYDAYRNYWALYGKAWFLNQVESVQDKNTRKFIKMIFDYFKEHTQQCLREWYTNDPAWISAWLEGKKEPKLDFDSDALTYYEDYFDSHLYRIEHPK